MKSYLARLRVALLFLVLLFSFGCGQNDSMVNGVEGAVGTGGESAGGSDDGEDDSSNRCNFPSSCQNTLGRIASSVPIKISKISLVNSQGGNDFVINQEITMDGLHLARDLDKALNSFGPITPGKYSSIVLKISGARLILKPLLGGGVINVQSASGELKINLSADYLVTQEGRKGRILFDLCKNFVLQMGGSGDFFGGANGKPKGCTLTPEVNAKVVYL